MNKGICFYWGFLISSEEKAKILSKLGFNCVITNADKKFNYQSGNIKHQVKLFKKYNLKLSSLHMRYEAEDLSHFWNNDNIGKKLEKTLIKDIKVVKKYGFSCLVVHLKGKPSKIGLDRLNRLLNFCDKLDVNLAVENTSNCYDCIKYVFDNISNKHLRFCFDSGHGNVFETDIDYLSLYGDKLICLHLHDNDGSSDQHTLNKYGSINWDSLAKKLAKLNYNGNLDYEVMLTPKRNETALSVARQVYKQAVELEKLIEKYKKEN